MTDLGHAPSGTVGERIRGLLSDRKMSQRQLAAALAGDAATPKNVENVRRQISSWVNDQHVPGPENAEALAAALDVPAEWLTDAPPPRRSLSIALEELAQVMDALSEKAEKETARFEDAILIVQSLDRRLASIEASLGQLLEFQTAGGVALGVLLERTDVAGEGQSDRSAPS